MSRLDDLVRERREEVAARARVRSIAELESRIRDLPSPRGFAAALRGGRRDLPSVIAEIKFASPSQGTIRERHDVESVARGYAAAGAAALSVLTDAPRFGGKLEYLERAAGAADLPILCKDFIVEPYQLVEARAHRADAALAIVRLLDREGLRRLADTAERLAMDLLVEVHSGGDLEKIEGLPVALVGVNHRDLDTLAIDPERSARMADRLPHGAVRIAESGLSTTDDLARMRRLGFDAVLVGTHLMRRPDPGEGLAALLGGSRAAG